MGSIVHGVAGAHMPEGAGPLCAVEESGNHYAE